MSRFLIPALCLSLSACAGGMGLAGAPAQALPQSLVPALAFPVITLGGYPALFIGGAVVGIIGAVLVTRIKGVK